MQKSLTPPSFRVEIWESLLCSERKFESPGVAQIELRSISVADLGPGVQSVLLISDSPFNRFDRFRRAFNEFGRSRTRRSISFADLGLAVQSLWPISESVQWVWPISESAFNHFDWFRTVQSVLPISDSRSIALGDFGKRSISLADLGVQWVKN